MTARVAIDLNVRVRGNQTYAGLEDADGDLAPGDDVEVYEPETGLAGPARVIEVDNERHLVYLAVDWGQLREPEPPRRRPTWRAGLLGAILDALTRHPVGRVGSLPRLPTK